MNLEDLPEELKERIDDLQYGPASIEAEVQDALATAENIEDFREIVRDKMKTLIEECKGISDTFYDVTPKPPIKVVVNMFGGCIESVSCERPIDVIFVDPETEMVDDDAIQKIDGEDKFISHHTADDCDKVHVENIFKQVLANEEKKG